MKDERGREITYMRISVTNQCNYRCSFCVPDDAKEIPQMNPILTDEQILKIVRAAKKLGIHTFRITGGEPLVRKGIVDLIAKIKQENTKVYLSTNGFLLEDNLENLQKAGLDGLNISFCSTDENEYHIITKANKENMEKVKRAIIKASQMGFQTKVNCVPIKGMNDTHVADIAALAKENPIAVRFIEMMPIGQGKTFQMIENAKILLALEEQYGTAMPDLQLHGNGPASYYDFKEFKGKIGFISANSCNFCENCNRVRITADGWLKLCLCYEDGIDLSSDITQKSTEELATIMEQAILKKPKEHDFMNRAKQENDEKRFMTQIGG